jgi:hypothetical protein
MISQAIGRGARSPEPTGRLTRATTISTRLAPPAGKCLSFPATLRTELDSRSANRGSSIRPFAPKVVLSPGRPETALDAYRCEPVQAGVYHAVPGLVMRVVVLAELPRTRATLLLRLLGSGRRFREAVADLAALPRDAWEKSVAVPLLLHFGLDQQEPTADEEDEVSAEIRAWFEEYKQQLRDEGRAEEAARAVLTALRVRGIAVPDILRKRILIEKDPEILERWLERAIVAASIADVLPDLS